LRFEGVTGDSNKEATAVVFGFFVNRPIVKRVVFGFGVCKLGKRVG
jgi:hypothetical protein